MSDSENTDGKEALEYFKNLTCGPADHIMSLQDMEKVIKFHEEELDTEDKRVEGTDEYPNYGDDFADMVYIARRLLDEIERLREAFRIEQEEVAACCIDRKATQRERDEARRLLKAVVDMMRDNMAPDATHPKHVCDFIYCPEIATCMVCENWTDALVMCYPDDFQDEEETK